MNRHAPRSPASDGATTVESRHSAAVRGVYARAAAEYDRRWRRYLEATLPPTLRAADLPPAARVLDVGCGTGALLAMIAARDASVTAHGVDLTPAMLEVARDRLGARAALVAADAGALPFRSSAYDVVLTASALRHWPRPVHVLAEILRVLRPGGRLVLTDWSADHLVTRLRSAYSRRADPSHVHTHSAGEVREMLDRAGFEEIRGSGYSAGLFWGFLTFTARAPRGARKTAANQGG